MSTEEDQHQRIMSAEEDQSKEKTHQEIFSMSIFETLDQTQNTHGVMHEDYHQYQQYCTNRLYRLRHAQPVRRDLVHNSKYAGGVQMRRNAYCPRPRDSSEAVIPHENFLWVPLYQAERAWAQACEIQKQKRASKTQQLVLRKLRKAVKFATEMQEMSLRACDERTQQEINSYVDWMKGNYALQKQDYVKALKVYRSSMNGLLQLAQAQEDPNDPKSLMLADLWTMRAESILRPLVRFCQYECKDIDPELAAEPSTQSKQTESEIVIHFCGNAIPLDPYKELCVLYLKAEALEQQQSLDENSFLTLLSTFDDAIAYVGKELERYETIQSGPAVNARKVELQTLMAYWKYQKLQVCLHKNEERLKDCNSDAEMVHVYDALLQNAEQMAQVGSSGGSEQEEAEAHVLRIRALRCFALSKVYLGQLQQIPEARALWKQAKSLTKRAIEELAACDTRDKQHEKKIEEHLEALEKLETTGLPGLDVRLKAAAYLQKSGPAGGFTSGTDRPLWLRLEEFDPGTTGSMVDDPPRAIPIPCKPVFYDIAWKYAGGNFPVDQLQEEIDKREPQNSNGGGGILGWLTGSK